MKSAQKLQAHQLKYATVEYNYNGTLVYYMNLIKCHLIYRDRFHTIYRAEVEQNGNLLQNL